MLIVDSRESDITHRNWQLMHKVFRDLEGKEFELQG